MALQIRKGDLVQVVSGSDRGVQGRVLNVDRERKKLRVAGVRMQKRHVRAGRAGSRTGGIVEKEGYVDASSVMLVDPSDNKPGRFRSEVQEGKRVRVFVRSGEPVPEPEV